MHFAAAVNWNVMLIIKPTSKLLHECADLLAKRGEHTLNPSFEDVWRKLTSFTYDPAGEIIFEVGAGGSNSNSDSRMGNPNRPLS